MRAPGGMSNANGPRGDSPACTRKKPVHAPNRDVAALVQRPQRLGIRDDDLAAFGLDQALALELRQRERHGLARRADQVRELLMRDLERDQGAARVVDAVLAGKLDEQLGELRAALPVRPYARSRRARGPRATGPCANTRGLAWGQARINCSKPRKFLGPCRDAYESGSRGFSINCDQ